MKIVDLVQNTPEWLEWRKSGIGASDSPVIEEISPYKTRRELFLEKSGLVTIDESSNEFIFSLGHKTEGLIRKEFQELTRVEMKPICVVHPKYDYIFSSLDGYDSNLGVLEAKLVGQDALKKAKDGVIPPHHYSQIQHQLATVGHDTAQYFAHDGKKNGVLLTVKAEKNYQERLFDLIHQFKADLVSGKVPPLSDRDYLIPEDQGLLEDLKRLKKVVEMAEVEFELAKECAINVYGHTKISGNGIKIFKTLRQGAISYTKIPEVEQLISTLKQEYLDKFRGKSSESWTVKIDRSEND